MNEEDFTPVETSIEKNLVWRTITGAPITGWYVWDVIQVVGEVYAKDAHIYHLTKDNGHIMVQCFHFFTIEKAEEFLHERNPFQTVEVV